VKGVPEGARVHEMAKSIASTRFRLVRHTQIIASELQMLSRNLLIPLCLHPARVIVRMSPAAVSGTNQDHVNLCPTGMKLTATSCPCQAFDLPKIRELRLRALCQRRVSRCGFSGLRQTSDLLVRKYSARPNLTGHAPRPHFELYTRPYWQRLKPEAVWRLTGI